PPRPAPQPAQALAATVTAAASAVTSAASAAARRLAAVGDNDRGGDTLAAEVLHNGLRPSRLHAHAPQIADGSFVLEGVPLPVTKLNGMFSLEVSALITRPRLDHSEEAKSSLATTGATTAGRVSGSGRTYEGAVTFGALQRDLRDSGQNHPHGGYTYSSRAGNSESPSATRAVTQTPADEGRHHTVTGDLELLVTLTWGHSHLAAVTAGEHGSVSVVVSAADAIRFTASDAALRPYAQLFESVAGLSRPSPTADRSLVPPSWFTQEGSLDGAAATHLALLDADGNEQRDRLRVGMEAALVGLHRDILTPGTPGYAVGARTAARWLTDQETLLTVLTRQGQRLSVQFVAQFDGRTRLVTLSVEADLAATPDERNALRGSRAAGSLDQLLAVSPEDRKSEQTRTYTHQATFKWVQRFFTGDDSVPADDRGGLTQRPGLGLGGFQTTEQKFSQVATATDTTWLRGAEVGDFEGVAFRLRASVTQQPVTESSIAEAALWAVETPSHLIAQAGRLIRSFWEATPLSLPGSGSTAPASSATRTVPVPAGTTGGAPRAALPAPGPEGVEMTTDLTAPTSGPPAAGTPLPGQDNAIAPRNDAQRTPTLTRNNHGSTFEVAATTTLRFLGSRGATAEAGPAPADAAALTYDPVRQDPEGAFGRPYPLTRNAAFVHSFTGAEALTTALHDIAPSWAGTTLPRPGHSDHNSGAALGTLVSGLLTSAVSELGTGNRGPLGERSGLVPGSFGGRPPQVRLTFHNVRPELESPGTVIDRMSAATRTETSGSTRHRDWNVLAEIRLPVAPGQHAVLARPVPSPGAPETARGGAEASAKRTVDRSGEAKESGRQTGQLVDASRVVRADLLVEVSHEGTTRWVTGSGRVSLNPADLLGLGALTAGPHGREIDLRSAVADALSTDASQLPADWHQSGMRNTARAVAETVAAVTDANSAPRLWFTLSDSAELVPLVTLAAATADIVDRQVELVVRTPDGTQNWHFDGSGDPTGFRDGALAETLTGVRDAGVAEQRALAGQRTAQTDAAEHSTALTERRNELAAADARLRDTTGELNRAQAQAAAERARVPGAQVGVCVGSLHRTGVLVPTV
ncbi:hypothetical protein HCN52_15205, partial [Streptomyces bohaiensis]|nr:hypothetical protein [Streptomyces bohaiensis]